MGVGGSASLAEPSGSRRHCRCWLSVVFCPVLHLRTIIGPAEDNIPPSPPQTSLIKANRLWTHSSSWKCACSPPSRTSKHFIARRSKQTRVHGNASWTVFYPIRHFIAHNQMFFFAHLSDYITKRKKTLTLFELQLVIRRDS